MTAGTATSVGHLLNTSDGKPQHGDRGHVAECSMAFTGDES